MKQLAIMLTSAWPTDAGVLRPADGIISVSEAEAAKIVEANCGVIQQSAAPDLAPRKASARRSPASRTVAKPDPSPAVAEDGEIPAED